MHQLPEGRWLATLCSAAFLAASAKACSCFHVLNVLCKFGIGWGGTFKVLPNVKHA